MNLHLDILILIEIDITIEYFENKISLNGYCVNKS